MEEEKKRCEIGIMCRDTPEDEVGDVIQEAQIAGDLWVPVCRLCAAALTLLRKEALTKGNGGEGVEDDA
jgi:hypothetical protein